MIEALMYGFLGLTAAACGAAEVFNLMTGQYDDA